MHSMEYAGVILNFVQGIAITKHGSVQGSTQNARYISTLCARQHLLCKV